MDIYRNNLSLWHQQQDIASRFEADHGGVAMITSSQRREFFSVMYHPSGLDRPLDDYGTIKWCTEVPGDHYGILTAFCAHRIETLTNSVASLLGGKS